MKTIHLILQGKGGVGKSLVSSFICQYLGEKDEVLAIDTDPVNHTLHRYTALEVTGLEIRDGDNINPRKFDKLMEIIAEAADDRHIVIDNGAATFIPLCAWMRENQIIEMWHESNLTVLVHCVLTGGQAMDDTMDGLDALMKYFDAPIIVWLNSYFGGITYKGMQFEEFAIYQKNCHKISAIIRIPLKNPQTFGKDLEELFSRSETFAEALSDEGLPIMVRQRLRIFWNDMCQEIDKANL